MSIDLIAPYVTLDEFKDELGIRDLADDADLELVLSDGAEMINTYCRRSFHLETGTRTYDAPFSEYLLVADLQAVTGISWYGTALSGTDYLVTFSRDTEDYKSVIRLYGTIPMPYRWDLDPATGLVLGMPWGQIVIDGVWGYRASFDGSVWTELIPSKITRANLLLSARLWSMRSTRYTNEGGGAQIGRRPQAEEMMSDEVKTLLNPYIREPVPLIVGSPYAD